MGNHQRWASATYFCVRNRNSATRRKHFSNRNSATFKEMLLRNRNSAIPQTQFVFESAISSPQLQSFTSAIFGAFLAVKSDRFMKKKIWGKKFHATVPLRQFFVSRETDSSVNIFGWFLNPSWAEEKGLESSGTGRRLLKVAELRKSNFEGPQLQFRNFF